MRLPKQVPKSPTWQVSSYSENGGNCVEVALAPVVVRVRDTKARGDGALAFAGPSWQALLEQIRP
jgi:hypothetical protein